MDFGPKLNRTRLEFGDHEFAKWAKQKQPTGSWEKRILDEKSEKFAWKTVKKTK